MDIIDIQLDIIDNPIPADFILRHLAYVVSRYQVWNSTTRCPQLINI